jgi:hypothetical protein
MIAARAIPARVAQPPRELLDTSRHPRALPGDAHADAAPSTETPARDFSVTFTRGGAPVAVLLVGRSHDLL